MVAKYRNCEICGKPSRKRKVCVDCKTKYPYHPSGEKGKPFNRKELYVRDMGIDNKSLNTIK